jgi:hypothetical protein
LQLTQHSLLYNCHIMDARSEVKEFLDSARTQGASDEFIVGLLKGRGWPEEDAYRALADHFESRHGTSVPVYRRSGSAKDAFLYLLSFSTLATWTIGLGSVVFSLIERWIPDPLSSSSPYLSSNYQMADSLACVIVAFPVYLLTMRYVAEELERNPEKLESAVRKWLTYLALFIAAGIVVCDLVTFLTYFLRGEVTGRFLAKVLTALVIAGSVFWYYMGSLSKRTLHKSL